MKSFLVPFILVALLVSPVSRAKNEASEDPTTLAKSGQTWGRSPTGRWRLNIAPDAFMRSVSVKTAKTVEKQSRVVQQGALLDESMQVVSRLIRALESSPYKKFIPEKVKWQVRVIEDPRPNAFVLPSGDIFVHTGLAKVAKTPDQLAAVLGHELSHVLARHGAERMSLRGVIATFSMAFELWLELKTQKSKNPGLGLAGSKILVAALGLGALVGIQLPFSRTHESEADAIGLELMWRAGFIPSESVALWKNFDLHARSSGANAKTTSWMSTHPTHQKRAQDLADLVKKFETPPPGLL